MWFVVQRITHIALVTFCSQTIFHDMEYCQAQLQLAISLEIELS
jgi:hypothetical protein